MFETDHTNMRSRLLWHTSHPNYEMVSNLLCIINFVIIYIGELSSDGTGSNASVKRPVISWLSFEILFNFC